MTPGGFSLDGLLQVVTNVGLPGIVLLMYYLDQRAMTAILRQYRKDMDDLREMYEHNAELVRQYGALARDQKDMILMNTQAWTRTHEAVENNRYCPMVRLEKRAAGAQG